MSDKRLVRGLSERFKNMALETTTDRCQHADCRVPASRTDTDGLRSCGNHRRDKLDEHGGYERTSTHDLECRRCGAWTAGYHLTPPDHTCPESENDS